MYWLDAALPSELGRFFLLFPILFGIIFAVTMMLIVDNAQAEKLQEKFSNTKAEVDLIADRIESDITQHDDWTAESEYYAWTLIDTVGIVDKQVMTFAAVYDDELVNLSARTLSYERSAVDPTVYLLFRDAVASHDTGELELWYADEPNGVEGRSMLLYYRWVPVLDGISERYLVCVAVSEYSVSTQTADWVAWAVIAIVLISTLISLACIAYMRHIAFQKQALEMLLLSGKNQQEGDRGERT
jgi:hypothetical protein